MHMMNMSGSMWMGLGGALFGLLIIVFLILGSCFFWSSIKKMKGEK